MFKTLFAFALLLLPQTMFGDEKPVEYLVKPKLEMGVSLSAEEIVQFEPVVLKVSIRNASHETQKVYRALDPMWQFLKVFVIDADGKTHELKPYTSVPHGRIGHMELPTFVNRNGVVGTGVHHRILLTPFPGGWLDTPGKYKVYATFNYAKGKKIGSSSAKLTVKPADGVSKEALERFRGFPQAKFLASDTFCLAIAEEFRAVIREYPESVYTPWCYYVLGRAYQRQQDGDVKSNAINARQNYKALLKKHPGFPLKLEVQYEMNRELIRLGKSDEAIYEINKLIKLDPRADNTDAELFLFYEARRILNRMADGNQKEVTYYGLPTH